MLYTETDLEESMDKIETINFHEVKEVAGIKFWCYHAGHVLGAAMFMIEIAGVKVPSSPAALFPPGVRAQPCAGVRAHGGPQGTLEAQRPGTDTREQIQSVLCPFKCHSSGPQAGASAGGGRKQEREPPGGSGSLAAPVSYFCTYFCTYFCKLFL